jgi:hypothetical protein
MISKVAWYTENTFTIYVPKAAVEKFNIKGGDRFRLKRVGNDVYLEKDWTGGITYNTNGSISLPIVLRDMKLLDEGDIVKFVQYKNGFRLKRIAKEKVAG